MVERTPLLTPCYSAGVASPCGVTQAGTDRLAYTLRNPRRIERAYHHFCPNGVLVSCRCGALLHGTRASLSLHAARLPLEPVVPCHWRLGSAHMKLGLATTWPTWLPDPYRLAFCPAKVPSCVPENPMCGKQPMKRQG